MAKKCLLFLININLNFLESVRAVTPFLDRMPSEMHEEFLDDYIDIVSSMQLTDVSLVDGSDCKFRTPYKLIVAYASK